MQSRPITTIGEYGPAAGNRLIWDNSNIIESYSGVTLPLTFSFIRQAYAAIYRGFAEIKGVDAGTLRLLRHVFENMLGFFRGRVYYNIMNWYRIIGLFPGFRYNKVFLESMLGMKHSMEYTPPRQASAQGPVYRLFWEPLLMMRVVGQTLYNFNRLEKLVNEFEANFEFHFTRWKQIDFDRQQPHELMNVYREMEESLLLKWKTPTINDFFVMIYYGLLKRLCLDWCQDKEGTLQNDLICGEGDIVSTAPARMAIDIAGKISKNSDWRSLFENSSPAELACRVPNDKDLMPIWEAVQDYLDLYGYRRMNELKLEEPTLIENPEFFYQTLKNYLSMDPARLNSEAMKEHERHVRSQAEARVFSILRKSLKAQTCTSILGP